MSINSIVEAALRSFSCLPCSFLLSFTVFKGLADAYLGIEFYLVLDYYEGSF